MVILGAVPVSRRACATMPGEGSTAVTVVNRGARACETMPGPQPRSSKDPKLDSLRDFEGSWAL